MELLSAIKIIDVIRKINNYTNKPQYYLILNRMPEFYFTRMSDNLLIGEDDGLYQAYLYYNDPCSKAFAGREFDIKLVSGSTIKARGNWWDAPELIKEDVVPVGISTLEELRKCYVFCSSHIERNKLEHWLINQEPSEDYYKYDQKNL